MVSTPNFINHYTSQIINEDAVIELNKLAKDYFLVKKEIDTPERQRGDARYKEIFGRENPRSVRNEVKALDEKYKEAAKNIAAKYAEQEGIPFILWKDPEPEKTIEQKAKETTQSLDASQDKMNTMLHSVQEKKQENEQQLTPKTEREKKVEELKQQWAKIKDKEHDH